MRGVVNDLGEGSDSADHPIPQTWRWMVTRRRSLIVIPPSGVRPLPDQEPWISLSNAFANLDAAVEIVTDLDRVDRTNSGLHLLAFNATRRAAMIADRLRIPVERRALLAMEPPSTFPAMYQPSKYLTYGHRFAPSPIWAAQLQAVVVPWPWAPMTRAPVDGQSGNDQWRATLLAANKRSAHHSSLYRLRRELVREVADRSLPILVCGRGWDDPAWKQRLLGVKAIADCALGGATPSVRQALSLPQTRRWPTGSYVPDKVAAMARAPIAIVVENSQDYVSEKVFDALWSGAVPVYVGGSIADSRLPNDAVVEVGPRCHDVMAAVFEMSNDELHQRREAATTWLQSEKLWRFLPQEVFDTISSALLRT